MPSISLPVAILGAGAISTGVGAYSASQAAKAQQNAAQTAANTQMSIFNKTSANLAPYNQMGQSAVSQLASLFGLGGSNGGVPNAAAATSALTQFPGYQFGLQQGTQALDRSAASQGLLLSGGQLKAAQQYGQGYAMQNAWNPYVSQLNTSAGLGENAAAMVGNQGVQTGANVGASQLAAGQAQASGIIGTNNAIQGGLQSSLLSYALQNQNGQYGAGAQGAINSGQTMGVSNGGYNYLDNQAGTYP